VASSPTRRPRSLRRVDPAPSETFVLRRVSWVFAALGVIALSLFALEPNIHAHPQLPLLGVTGLVGVVTLRGLARLFASMRRDDD
jgi:hypothetical protein